jgi:hypothetical protein
LDASDGFLPPQRRDVQGPQPDLGHQRLRAQPGGQLPCPNSISSSDSDRRLRPSPLAIGTRRVTLVGGMLTAASACPRAHAELGGDSPGYQHSIPNLTSEHGDEQPALPAR